MVQVRADWYPQMIELGNRSDSWNIMGDIRDAARQVTSAQVRGIKLEDQLGQRRYVRRRDIGSRWRPLPAPLPPSLRR